MVLFLHSSWPGHKTCQFNFPSSLLSQKVNYSLDLTSVGCFLQVDPPMVHLGPSSPALIWRPLPVRRETAVCAFRQSFSEGKRREWICISTTLPVSNPFSFQRCHCLARLGFLFAQNPQLKALNGDVGWARGASCSHPTTKSLHSFWSGKQI